MASRPNSRERVLLTGVIQLANACLKLAMGQRRAALRLLAEAAAELRESAARQPAGEARVMGLDPGALAAGADALARNVDAADAAARRPGLMLEMHDSAGQGTS